MLNQEFNIMKYFYFLSIAIISGCSAMGVPATSDPYKKITQSYQLLSINRPVPAEFIAQDALKIFEANGDNFGAAEANYFLGVFYKYKSGWPNTNKVEYIDKAIVHLNKSAESFKLLNENIQASKAVFELANAYRGLEDKEKYCQYYEESLSLYISNSGEHKTFKIFNSNFKTPDALIEAHLEQLCGNNA